MTSAFNIFCDESDQIMRPVQNNNEKQVYIEPDIEDHNLLNFINDSDDCNLKSASLTEELLSPKYENVSQVVSIECTDTLQSATNFQVGNTNKEYEVFHHSTRVQKCHKFVHLLDNTVPPRAVATLPTGLYFKYKCNSVIPRRSLPTKVKFGPVSGVNHVISNEESQENMIEAARLKVPIFLKKINGIITYIDVSDRDKSNWFSILPLGDQNTANVWLHQEGERLYGVAVRSIAARTPLILGYSKQYADEHNIPLEMPILDIAQDLSEDLRLQCHELVHKYEKTRIVPRRGRGRLRCRYCMQTFCRVFTLKRHMLLSCSKKTEKTGLRKSDSLLPEVVPTTTLNIEDTRLPSDESLQNYSNGLDFSTSLFDTDRISNLDISGGSRSETEFNPYGVSSKDESGLAADLGLTTNFNELDKQTSLNEDQNQSKPLKSVLTICRYCNETIVFEKKKQHLRECKERNLMCECGRVFKNRVTLAQHIHTRHRNSVPVVQDNKNQRLYQCEKCDHSYMRRGMLVNHLWVVHGSRAEVPLERPVRHYPCVACPKLYRAAAKRDVHVRKHHPGVELVKGGSIDGGTRACEPAACTACPRQYASRSKMLQHMRAAHPHLAPPKQRYFKSK